MLRYTVLRYAGSSYAAELNGTGRVLRARNVEPSHAEDPEAIVQSLDDPEAQFLRDVALELNTARPGGWS